MGEIPIGLHRTECGLVEGLSRAFVDCGVHNMSVLIQLDVDENGAVAGAPHLVSYVSLNISNDCR
jgi:hypothetical protein